MNLPFKGTPLLPPGVVAPEKQTLRLVCEPKFYAIAPELQPTQGELDGLYLRESHVPKPEANMPKHFGEYTLTLEGTIENSDDLNAVPQKLTQLANDLNRFWPYSCGELLFPVGFTLSFDAVPNGWQSNIAEVRAYLVSHCHQRFAVVQMGPNRHWVTLPFYPLLPALQARDKFQKSDPIIQALADLHFAALRSPFGEGRWFSFARALELARKILPGRDDPAKEKSLGLSQGSLKRSFHWLFDVGNNRYNTRHVVRRDSSTTALNSRMTGQELMDYQQDADLILRTIICKEWKLVTPSLLLASEQIRQQLQAN